MTQSGDYVGFSPLAILIGYPDGDSPEREDTDLWADSFELNYPILADVDGEVLEDWVETRWFPAYVIDRSGRIRWTDDEGRYVTADVQEVVEELLAEEMLAE